MGLVASLALLAVVGSSSAAAEGAAEGAAEQAAPRLLAVIVGAGALGDSGLAARPSAATDARALHAALTGPKVGWSAGDIVLLADDDATRPRVEEAVKAALEQAGARDGVLISIATREIVRETDRYLGLAGTRPDALDETALPVATLARWLRETGASPERLVILDACTPDGAEATKLATLFEHASEGRAVGAMVLAAACGEDRERSLAQLLSVALETPATPAAPLTPASSWRMLEASLKESSLDVRATRNLADMTASLLRPGGESPPPAVKPTPDITPPKLLRSVKPKTPPGEWRGERVIVQCIITATGDVVVHRWLKVDDPRLQPTAEAALKKWKYEPARSEGKPLAVYAIMTFEAGKP